MVVVDANVLLYAVDSEAKHHDLSRAWLDRALGGAEAVGFSWVAVLAFLRIGTNARIFPSPLSLDDAGVQVQEWLGAPAAVMLEPTARHLGVLLRLLAEAGTAGNLTSDAHLAALAAEHNADVVSFDRDFGRFPGIRHRLPG